MTCEQRSHTHTHRLDTPPLGNVAILKDRHRRPRAAHLRHREATETAGDLVVTWEPTGQLQPFLDQNQQGQTDGPNGLYKKARERAAAQQQHQEEFTLLSQSTLIVSMAIVRQ